MAANLQAPNREALLLPDKITPYDNLDLPPPPDASWLLTQNEDVTATPIGRKGRVSNRDINLQEEYDNSQFLNDNPIREVGLGNMDDLDLELDFGLDFDEPNQTIEVGRDAPAPRPVEDDIFSELEGGLRQKDRENSIALDFGDNGVRIADAEGDITMGDDFGFNPDDQSVMPAFAEPGLNRARISESPLSDIDEALAREVEAEYTNNRQTDLYEPEDETETTLVRRPANRAKKQRVLMPDEETTLSSHEIRAQQADRTNIMRDTAFLPSNPFLLALMDMQKSGGFVSTVLMDGRGTSWAPELRGMLSLDAIQKSQELKRKRDSGIADVESEQGNAKSPRLELDEDEDTIVGPRGVEGRSNAGDGSIVRIGGDGDDEDESGIQNDEDNHAPLSHAADGGLVSLGTKHAVHVLRDLFGPEAATSQDKRKKSAVVFQDVLPEKKTSKAEATKMFFECLVLATKDAVKIEQGSELGAPIRVQGKSGLWGEWAEREAGGEIAHEDEPERPAAAAPVVAVEA